MTRRGRAAGLGVALCVLVVAAAVAAGAAVEKPIAQHRYGKLAVLADPFGHGFCFVQFQGRGYDEIASGVG